MSHFEKVIIVVGAQAVGKSTYCRKMIDQGYEIVDCELQLEKTFENIKKCKSKFIVMDYYFWLDYNAEKLRKLVGCEVELIILIEHPLEVALRQLDRKRFCFEVNAMRTLKTYEEDLRQFVEVKKCRFVFREKEINYREFKELLYKFRAYPLESEVEGYYEWMRSQEGYDYNYHTLELPYGITLHKDNYSRNVEMWEVFGDWIDWKNKKILELGCFHGYFAQKIYERGGNVLTADKNLLALRSAITFAWWEKYSIDFMYLDLDQGFPKKNFDIGLCTGIFHHIKEQDVLLKNLQKIPVVLFEIFERDKGKIQEYFHIDREVISPKDDRIILLTRGKK